MTITITEMTAQDWRAVAAIYQEGIDTGDATFEAAPPSSWEEWRKTKLNACSIVARAHDEIVGWAALSPVSSRGVYAGVAEVSVYVSAPARGHSVGSLLLDALIKRSEAHGLWTLQAGIFPENQASIRLHLQHGFRQVGIREKLGKMAYGPHAGKWRNVVLLERRSATQGVE
ncbi:N-acetyltransferase [candidate division KSB1 bacterium]|nr:MAG: N-acetyltransferase [candidate division KSB1 bacterium]